VPPQRVWFLSRFGLKTSIDFEHFGLKLGMVNGGTFTKAYKFILLPSNRWEKLVREIESREKGRVTGERERVDFRSALTAYAMLNHVQGQV